METRKKFIQAIVFVTTGAVSFGMLGTFVKLAAGDGYATPAITFAQVFVALLTMLLLHLVPHRKADTRWTLNINEKLKVILHGVCVGMISVFYFLSIRYGTAATSIVLLAQSVWMSVLLEALLSRRFPGKRSVIAVLAILAGTLLSTNMLASDAKISIAGIGFGLLAAVVNTTSIYLSNRVVVSKAPIHRTLFLITGCLLIVTLIWGSTLAQALDLRIFWKWGIVLALTGMVLPPLLYIRGMPVLGVGLSSIVTCLQIPASAIFAHLILKEQVGGVQWLGIDLIVIAIVFMNANALRKR